MPSTPDSRIETVSRYPTTPTELLEARFDWLRRGDFSSIYASYHADARFHELFASLEDYRRFAEENDLASLALERLEVIAQQERGSLARVLTFQEYTILGERHHYLDITSFRLQDGVWQVLSGKRVVAETSDDFSGIDWESVDHHPDAVTY